MGKDPHKRERGYRPERLNQSPCLEMFNSIISSFGYWPLTSSWIARFERCWKKREARENSQKPRIIKNGVEEAEISRECSRKSKGMSTEEKGILHTYRQKLLFFSMNDLIIDMWDYILIR